MPRKRRGSAEYFLRWLDGIYLRNDLKTLVESTLLSFNRHLFFNTQSDSEIKRSLYKQFGLDSLRHTPRHDLARTNRNNFSEEMKNSFLVEMMKVARSHSIKLYFVRIQNRPDRRGQLIPITAADVEYLRDLEKYIRSEGHGYHDFTGDPKLKLKMYSEGDHISRRYRKETSELFVERIGVGLQ